MPRGILHDETTQDHLHRRRLDRVHEEHRRRRPAAPGAVGREDRADGHQPAAARRKRDHRQQADLDARRHGDDRDLLQPAQGARRRRLRRRLPSRSAATSPARSPISKSPRNTACARPSPTRSASAASCAASAPCRISGRSARTCSQVCPEAIMLQYVNPMAINTWAIAEKYPTIKQVGLCHSVQGTAMELAHDLDIPYEEIRYRSAGINHMAFYLKFEHRQPDGSYRDLYPDLVRAYREGRAPKPGLEPALPQQGALRDADPARLFRHRKLGALRRIHALFHQGRPRGPDREVRHSARRISEALHRADRALEEARRSLPHGRQDRGQRSRRNTPPRS